MAILTLQELNDHIAAFKQALLALAVNQSYKLGNREFVRADIQEIRKTLEYLDRKRNKLVSGSGTLSNGVTSRLNRDSDPHERNTIASRAQDLMTKLNICWVK